MTETNYHLRAVFLPHGTHPIDVWISGGKLSFRPVENAQELAGNFMAPGLVDGHVHLSIDFANSGLPAGSKELVLYNAERHLRAGVLAVRDAGYVQQLDIDGVALPPMPVIQRSGWIVVPQGRFFPGTQIGKVTDPGMLVERVHEVADKGLSWFKVIADFPGADMDLFNAQPNYPIEEIRAALDAAHKRGMRMMAHSTGKFVDELVSIGVDAIEHGMSATERTVGEMARNGVHWTPTIATAEEFLLAAEKNGAPSSRREDWSARLRTCLPLAVAIGVPVLAGSDELPHGWIVNEMGAMMRHGLSAHETIDAASRTGRRMLNLDGFEEDASADLVLWENDPRLNISEIGQPKTVIAAGRVVDLDAPLPDVPGTDKPVRQRMTHRDDSECVFGH